MILNPGKAKSVVLTDQGLAESERLFRELFERVAGGDDQRRTRSMPAFSHHCGPPSSRVLSGSDNERLRRMSKSRRREGQMGPAPELRKHTAIRPLCYEIYPEWLGARMTPLVRRASTAALLRPLASRWA